MKLCPPLVELLKSSFTILTTITHLGKTDKGGKKVPIRDPDCRSDPSGSAGLSRPFPEYPSPIKNKKNEIQLWPFITNPSRREAQTRLCES